MPPVRAENNANMGRDDRVRLFIGVYPPPEAVGAMLASVEALTGDASLDLPEFRTTPAEQVHLTVHFIGPVRTGEVDGIAESLERAASGITPFELAPTKLIALPPRDPRLLAVETMLPAELAELQRRLVTRLASKSSGRAYMPHITVCRFKGRGPRGFAARALEIPGFSVTEVSLMRSVLRPEGAEHRLVARVGLGAL